MPPFGIALVVYIAGGGVLWFTAYLLSPVGYEISLGRSVGAAILISLVGILEPCLRPFVGGWGLLILLLVQMLIFKRLLWLTFWRSVATITVYWAVMLLAVYVLNYSPWAKGNRQAAVPRASARE